METAARIDHERKQERIWRALSYEWPKASRYRSSLERED
jgi:hypothetical protein